MRKPNFLLTLTMAAIALASYADTTDKESWQSIHEKYQKQFAEEQYDDAEKTASKVLRIAKKEYGRDSFCVAFSLNNLSLVHKKLGHQRESEEYFSDALEMTEELIGTRDQKIAEALKHARGGTGYRFGADNSFSDFNLNTLPWIKWGNSPMDRTPPNERLDNFYGAFLPAYLGPSNKAMEQFQRDADVVRLEHILYWSELMEEYFSIKGSYPFQDQLKEDDLACLVKIASKVQRQFISPGSKEYNPELDMNADKRFKEIPVKQFVSEIATVLGREIKERYDIQKAPTHSPIGYYYFASKDGYLIWCICPTYGVSMISTLLMDGFTPTVNIVSEGMKGKVTKALTRDELLSNPIFKRWQKRKLTKGKETYIRKLIAKNEEDSKTP